MLSKFLIFLAINFAALGIGSLLMGEGPSSAWYRNLQQAPWTPPGWVFGTAWTTIMICFALYMTKVWETTTNRQLLILLFCMQWLFNVGWNPAFFRYHQVVLGLLIIVVLTALVGFMFFYYLKTSRFYSLLIMPYFLWLLVATSLNGYIYFNNS